METHVLPHQDNGAAADLLSRGQALQQTRGAYSSAIAVQQPRSLPRVQKMLLDEAKLAGDGFVYSFPAGKGERIEGPSVKLAMAAARCWGNCAVDAQPVQELSDAFVFTSVFIDLETGFTLTRQYRLAKGSTIYGKFDEARKMEMRFAIGQSKAARNVIINALPSWLIDQAMSEAKNGFRAKIEAFIQKNTLPKAVDLTLKALKGLGVSEASVLSKLEIADKKAIDADMLIRIAADKSAIDQGQERAEDLFPPPPDAKTAGLRDRLEKAAHPPVDPPVVEEDGGGETPTEGMEGWAKGGERPEAK